MLASLGRTVVTAEDGVEAVDAFAPRPFEIVLMDCQLPGIDGYEATRRIRTIELTRGCVRTPIIAVTANAMPGDRERCIDSGMDDQLPKPLRRAQPGKKLEQWLSHVPAAGPASGATAIV